MRKFVEFRFVLGNREKTISCPVTTPFKYVMQFAAEEFEVNAKISSIVNYEAAPLDTGLISLEVWQVYGSEVYIRCNS
jgi:Ubiquitin fold modifier 1 protein